MGEVAVGNKSELLQLFLALLEDNGVKADTPENRMIAMLHKAWEIIMMDSRGDFK